MESKHRTNQGQNSLLKLPCQLIQGKGKEKKSNKILDLQLFPTVEYLLDLFHHAYYMCQFLCALC